MTKYAVLENTGNRRSVLIKDLLMSSQQKTVHAYCRNESKLRQLVLEVINKKNFRIFESIIYDEDLVKECIRDTKADSLVVGTNDNVPCCHLSRQRHVRRAGTAGGPVVGSSGATAPEATQLGCNRRLAVVRHAVMGALRPCSHLHHTYTGTCGGPRPCCVRMPVGFSSCL